MVRVINLDSGAYVQDALGRRVIDIDLALAQVRVDADKVYVKDPRVKGGGYYRTIKGGSGKPKGKGRLGATTPAIRKAVAKGTAAGLGITALAGLGTAVALRAKSEKKLRDLKQKAKENSPASKGEVGGLPSSKPEPSTESSSNSPEAKEPKRNRYEEKAEQKQKEIDSVGNELLDLRKQYNESEKTGSGDRALMRKINEKLKQLEDLGGDDWDYLPKS